MKSVKRIVTKITKGRLALPFLNKTVTGTKDDTVRFRRRNLLFNNDPLFDLQGFSINLEADCDS
jgi:hypothetical protein